MKGRRPAPLCSFPDSDYSRELQYRVAESRQHAAQRIGQKEVGGFGVGRAAQFGKQLAAQRVVVRAALQIATAVVVVFVDPESIDRQLRDTAACGALQGAIAAGIVGIPLLVAAGNLPFHHLIQWVIAERGSLVGIGARRHLAMRVVLAQILGRARIGTRRAQGIESLQVMGRAAAAIEVLLVAAGSKRGALP
jgi:hypothetical protein